MDGASVDRIRLPPGARPTRQRELILRTVEGWPGSFTVKEIFDAARTSDSRLGIATTYRTVELLLRNGSVSALTGSLRAAYVRCRPGHHHHLVCVECGSVEETELCGAPAAAELQRRYGFAAQAHEVDIYGTCRDCQ